MAVTVLGGTQWNSLPMEQHQNAAGWV